MKSTWQPANIAANGNACIAPIDVSLIVLASVSAGVFLLAFGVIRHLGPRHAFWLESAALLDLHFPH